MATMNDSNSEREDRQVKVSFPGGETSSSYHIVENPSGEILLVRGDGIPIGKQERDILQDAVRLSERLATKTTAVTKACAILKASQWIIPMSKQDIYGKSGGVYFAMSNDLPGLVKIGYTSKRFSFRLNKIRKELRLRHIVCKCAVITPQFKIVEQGLHAIFDDCRVRGEWFEADSVFSWVNDFLAESAA